MPQDWSSPEQPKWHPSEQSSDNAPSPHMGGRLWMQLLQQPLLFWGGVWVGLLLVGSIAMTGLMSPQLAKRDEPLASSALDAEAIAPAPAQPAPDPSASPSAPPTPADVPVWSLGAIALSCAAGSLMLARQLKQSYRYEPLVKPQLSATTAMQGNQRPSTISASRSTSGPISGPAPDLSRSELSASAMPAVPVDVVPLDESHPLDWSEASLADLMDIRRRHLFSRY